ncbi:MAG: hypothetical protein WEB52_14995 [Dehalococcoidia bacterium]
MSRLFFESDASEPCPIEFGGATDPLVAFLSFAFAARYGAQHDLTKLAMLLRGERKIDLTPLLTFADRNVEVDADRLELERVWQPAAPLAATIDAVVEALESGDERIDALFAGTPGVLPRLRDLGAMARWAAGRDARVRLTFEL